MTPILYNKITPRIQKPLLALLFFLIGFACYSALIIFPYHYGIIVPKKEGIIAISSFALLFVMYAFFTYDSYSGFKFPYIIQKYLIDPKLRHDLEDNIATTLEHAYILDLQPSSKSTYALLLQSVDLAEPEWFQVNLNLMFPKLYFFEMIKMQESCIGQEINIEYLPQSKVILKLCASNLEDDFSNMDNAPFFCPVPKQLDRIPSQFLLDFQKIETIYAERDGVNPQHYHLLCKIADKVYSIPSSSKGFNQLEMALGSKIKWSIYHDFQQDPKTMYAKLSS